jgi:ABC-type uncharacterized transport system permease subunit
MKKKLRFISIIQSARMGRELINPVNSLIELIGSVCFFVLHIFSFAIIIGKFSFPGWSTGEMWIMLFTFELFTYAAFFLFWKGLVHTVRDINRGGFDYLLTKPISTRLLTFFRSGGLHNFICMLFSFIGIFVVVNIFNIHITFISLLLFLLSLLISLWIFHSLSVMLIALNFYFGYLPATSSAPFQIQEIYKYPSSIFNQSDLWAWFTVIPLSLLTTVPSVLILTKGLDSTLYIGYAVMFLFFTLLSGHIWKKAIVNYASSGS